MKMNDNRIQSNDIKEYIQSKGWMYILLLTGLMVLSLLIAKGNIAIAIGLGAAPMLLVIFVPIIANSPKGFYVLFSFQFLLVGAGMFFNIKNGVATLLLTLSIIALLLVYNVFRKIEWRESINIMSICFIVLGAFCILELGNPNNVQDAWNIAITHYFVYPFTCAILVPMAVKNIKGIHWLLIIWSIFILIAASKGLYQKFVGFNERELYFLYALGGAKTHLIWSGVRYFSCFSDAASFGSHMAMAISTFGISIFFVEKKWMKIYFLFIALIAVYCMGLSGTRSAIAIPGGAAAMFIFLSGKKRYAFVGLVVVVSMLLFFRFTELGNGNQYIRKMRSAFFPTEDASYLVRVENRKKMKELLKYKPMGYGLGLSKGENFRPNQYMPYAPDSWLVAVWVETGIIGLSLYLTIHAILFAWCSWLLMFRIRHKFLRGLLCAWICTNVGFFVAAYVNDVMNFPNPYVVYTGFALCVAGLFIEKRMKEEEEEKKKELEMT